MLRSLNIALVLSLFGAMAAFGAPRPKADTEDLAKLEGTWEFTSWDHYGRPLDAESRETASWSVKGDKYTFQIQGIAEEGTIKLDPSKKPAAIDLAITEGKDKGKAQLGIYKIEKDTITFCLARPGMTERPTDFTSTAENEFILVTIKRVKKDD
jgi:uncharacterized protein (TIGR03067 family)